MTGIVRKQPALIGRLVAISPVGDVDNILREKKPCTAELMPRVEVTEPCYYNGRSLLLRTRCKVQGVQPMQQDATFLRECLYEEDLSDRIDDRRRGDPNLG